MGKYIKKKKLDGEALSLIDVSPSPLGVLTRAKSLALQRRLQKPPSSPSPNPPPSKQKITDCSGGSYLQLRSRRLQKKPPPIVVIRSSKRRKQRREEEGRTITLIPKITSRFEGLVAMGRRGRFRLRRVSCLVKRRTLTVE